MATERSHEPCARPDSLQLEEAVWDFDRRLVGRQSQDNSSCTRGVSRKVCNQYSEEFLNNVADPTSENHSAFSRMSICDQSWNQRQIQHRFQECPISDAMVGSEDSCHCERTRVSVVSYSSGSTHSAPATPSNYPSPSFPPLAVDVTTTQRRCTSLSVEPSPHYLGLPEPSRPFTSVNLTLRPPSLDPQPIDISSEAGNLTYSSCSYDPRQGFQSRLQISIGPGGQGTVSAARTLSHRPPPSVPCLRPASSLPDVATTSYQLISNLPAATKVLVAEQLERKERLSHELNKNRERLMSMQKEAHTMRTNLESRLTALPSSARVRKLQEEITMLQTECSRMTGEVDQINKTYDINTELIPLGETNEAFYKNIYRGQLFSRHTVRQRLPAPAPGEGRSWTCHMCTFHNHPDLNKCEQCEMPRMITGSPAPSLPCVASALPSA